MLAPLDRDLRSAGGRAVPIARMTAAPCRALVRHRRAGTRHLRPRFVWGARVSHAASDWRLVVALLATVAMGVLLGLLAGSSAGSTAIDHARYGWPDVHSGDPAGDRPDVLTSWSPRPAWPTVIVAITIPEVPSVGASNGAVAGAHRPRAALCARPRSARHAPAPYCVRHVLPNMMAPLMVRVATYIGASAVRVEAKLSFLGAGAPPEVPSWGQHHRRRPQFLIANRGLTHRVSRAGFLG